MAPHWRIRSGVRQWQAALTVEVNLALALAAAGASVDFSTVWEAGHSPAETTGRWEDNCIDWIRTVVTA